MPYSNQNEGHVVYKIWLLWSPMVLQCCSVKQMISCFYTWWLCH